MNRLKDFVLSRLQAKWEGQGADLIFDFDGTIATLPIKWSQQRERFQEYLSSIGLSNERIGRLDEMEFGAISRNPNFKFEILKFRATVEASAGRAEPISDTIDLLNDHDGRLTSCRLFIVSNNLRNTVMRELHRIGLADRFHAILCLDDVLEPKPSAKAGVLLRDDYGVVPAKAIMLGDSEATDGKFCENLGIEFVNITKFCN